MTNPQHSVPLIELADISVGLMTVRMISKKPTPYEYKTLNLRSAAQQEAIDLNRLDVSYYQNQVPETYFTRQGDVIVRNAKPYIAIAITRETEGLVIPSCYIVIRVLDPNQLDPDYLAWHINTPKVQQTLYREATGYLLAPIGAQQFKRLQVPLPAISYQRKLMDFNALAKKEVDLLRQLADAREMLYNSIMKRF